MFNFQLLVDPLSHITLHSFEQALNTTCPGNLLPWHLFLFISSLSILWGGGLFISPWAPDTLKQYRWYLNIFYEIVTEVNRRVIVDEYKKQWIKITGNIQNQLISTWLMSTCDWLKRDDYLWGRTKIKLLLYSYHHIFISLSVLISLLVLPSMKPLF